MKKTKNILKSLGLTFSLIYAQLIFASSVFATNTVNNTTGIDATFDKLFNLASSIVSGITGILSIVMVFIFSWKAFQFARTGDNPSERMKNINGLIFFFIGAACFGAASLITGIFSGMLTGI